MLPELLRRRDDERDNDDEFEGDGMDSPDGDVESTTLRERRRMEPHGNLI